jgi:hypothetical protein
MARTMKIGRDAERAQFRTVKVAKEHPKTHVVETTKYDDDNKDTPRKS